VSVWLLENCGRGMEIFGFMSCCLDYMCSFTSSSYYFFFFFFLLNYEKVQY